MGGAADFRPGLRGCPRLDAHRGVLRHCQRQRRSSPWDFKQRWQGADSLALCWSQRASIAFTRRAHTLSQLLEDGYSIRAADMPGADDLMMRIYAAMAQKERELISERTRAAGEAAKARGVVLGGGRGYRPSAAPSAAAATAARADEADRTAHRVRIEIARLQGNGVTTLGGLARELTALGIPTPRRGRAWTHTTMPRVVERAQAVARGTDDGSPQNSTDGWGSAKRSSNSARSF